MSELVYTTINLSNEVVCQIAEIKPVHIWIASFHKAVSPLEYDIFPFILVQVVIIDGKQATMEYLADMDMSDYIDIMEVVDVLMKKLPKF